MPLVRIEIVKGRTAEQKQALKQAIHTAIVETYGIPERDFFHIITEHETEDITAQDAGLGFKRSENLVIVQIFTQRGRSTEQKQALYAAINNRLGEAGVAPADTFIGYVENGPEDWSFGFGEAQYITGKLGIPQ